MRWIVAQKNRVRNGELYRFIADSKGAFVQVRTQACNSRRRQGFRPSDVLSLLAVSASDACLTAIGGWYLHTFVQWQQAGLLARTGGAHPCTSFSTVLCCAVQPALYEAFGLTVIEAMTCGLPTFATCNGGPSEIIKNGKSGFHIDPYHGAAVSATLIAAVARQAWIPFVVQQLGTCLLASAQSQLGVAWPVRSMLCSI